MMSAVGNSHSAMLVQSNSQSALLLNNDVTNRPTNTTTTTTTTTMTTTQNSQHNLQQQANLLNSKAAITHVCASNNASNMHLHLSSRSTTLSDLKNCSSKSSFSNLQTRTGFGAVDTIAQNSSQQQLLVKNEIELQNLMGQPLATECDAQSPTECCLTHPKKYARYRLERDDRQRFCSKCALKFAVLGEKIEELMSENQRTRKIQIDRFLSDLTQSMHKNEYLQEKLEEKVQEVRGFHERAEDRVKKLFSHLEELLAQKRQILVEKVQESLIFCVRGIDTAKQQAREFLKEQEKFGKDIRANYEKIVNDMEMQPFTVVLQRYEERLASFKNYAREVAFRSLEVTAYDDQDLLAVSTQVQNLQVYPKKLFLQILSQSDAETVAEQQQHENKACARHNSHDSAVDAQIQYLNAQKSNSNDQSKRFYETSESTKRLLNSMAQMQQKSRKKHQLGNAELLAHQLPLSGDLASFNSLAQNNPKKVQRVPLFNLDFNIIRNSGSNSTKALRE